MTRKRRDMDLKILILGLTRAVVEAPNDNGLSNVSVKDMVLFGATKGEQHASSKERRQVR